MIGLIFALIVVLISELDAIWIAYKNDIGISFLDVSIALAITYILVTGNMFLAPHILAFTLGVNIVELFCVLATRRRLVDIIFKRYYS